MEMTVAVVIFINSLLVVTVLIETLLEMDMTVAVVIFRSQPICRFFYRVESEGRECDQKSRSSSIPSESYKMLDGLGGRVDQVLKNGPRRCNARPRLPCRDWKLVQSYR
jgi:hypothetical protein